VRNATGRRDVGSELGRRDVGSELGRRLASIASPGAATRRVTTRRVTTRGVAARGVAARQVTARQVTARQVAALGVVGLELVLLGFRSLNAVGADVPAGKQIFQRYCAECHAPGFGHPGTQQLGWTRGESRAVLEKRTDLQPAYIRLVVRQGLLEMPPFRPTEIDDTQLEQLANYLARPGKR
jgi:mono/diheme cytochrome c family protein